MAKVIILRVVSGSRDGIDWPTPGEFLDVPKDEAEQLARLGIARIVEVKVKPVERATAPKAETRKG
jgi:hypothetical protein